MSARTIDDLSQEELNEGLQYDAASGHLGRIRLSLKKGADVNWKRKKDGATALHEAAQNGKFKALRLLIAVGADLESRDIDGCTPLLRAIDLFKVGSNGADRCIDILIAKGANCFVKSNNAENALHIAAWNKSPELIRKFAALGVGLDEKTGMGESVMEMAIIAPSEECVLALLELGVPLEGERKLEGETAIAFARRKNWKRVVAMLEHGELSCLGARNVRTTQSLGL